MSIIAKGFQRFLLILYCGIIITVSGLMFLAFPFGAYVVFNTEIGGLITYQYPLNGSNPLNLQLGEIFIIAWCIYLSLFSLYLFKDKSIVSSILRSLKDNQEPKDNRLITIIVYFSILLLGSKLIDTIQNRFGITMGEISEKNLLLAFINLTVAPLIEEPLFRVLLIGLPFYLFFNKRKVSILSVLLNPSKNIDRQGMILISLSAFIFGILHIIFGWGYGKLSQATFAGVILGIVYYRYGLASSIILHWCTNYFLAVYGLFGSSVFGFRWNDVTSNPILAFIDILITLLAIITLFNYAKGILVKLTKWDQNIDRYQ